jgi:hypothetical protein
MYKLTLSQFKINITLKIKVSNGNTRNEDLVSLGVVVPQFKKCHHRGNSAYENINNTVEYCYQSIFLHHITQIGRYTLY